jgi:hypothetical protein
MADPFESSCRKLARAKVHLAELQREIAGFCQMNPYTEVTEVDPQRANHQVRKIKLTQPLPSSLPDIVGDIASNLRAVLDHAGYAVAVAAGKMAPKNTAFPFAGSLAQMANAIGRSKDLPPEIQSLFCGFQPYPGGDGLLWALNEICNGDKHKMLTPIGIVANRSYASVEAIGGPFEMPNPHIWDREKNEMVLVTLGPGAKFDYQFDFSLFVAFHEIKVVEGQPALRILHALVRKVESILMAIEAESCRLGFVT